MLTRRALLRDSAMLSLAPPFPASCRGPPARRPERDGRVLVVLQLDGGNDGINTVVPFGDEAYAKHRRELRLPTDKLLKIGDGVGLHPAMRPARRPVRERPAGDRPGGRLSEPRPFALREHGDLADRRPGPAGSRRPGWLGRALDAAAEATAGTGRASTSATETLPVRCAGADRDGIVCRRLRPRPGPPPPRRTRRRQPPSDDLAAFVQTHRDERVRHRRRPGGRRGEGATRRALSRVGAGAAARPRSPGRSRRGRRRGSIT